jgi:hypothetical protein
MQVRLVVMAIGLVVWGYGVFADDENVRLVGIIVLLISLILRFVPKRFRGDDVIA